MSPNSPDDLARGPRPPRRAPAAEPSAARDDRAGAARRQAQEYLERSLDLLWNGLPETSRGPKRTLTLDGIVGAAIAVADAEGIDALTMRRLARELGVGTMSLYRYVPDKSVLLDLMLDAVSRPDEADLPEPGSSWREVLALSARGGRRLYLRHRWLLQLNWTRPVLGPGSIGSMETMVSGLIELPFSDREKLMLISALDGYVVGSVRQEIQYDDAAAEAGVADEEFWGTQLPYLERAMSSGDYPTMAAMGEDTFSGGWEEGFELGLRLFLDGVEREVERRQI